MDLSDIEYSIRTLRHAEMEIKRIETDEPELGRKIRLRSLRRDVFSVRVMLEADKKIRNGFANPNPDGKSH